LLVAFIIITIQNLLWITEASGRRNYGLVKKKDKLHY